MQRLNIKTPDDITNIPGYVERVDPKETPLSHIIRSYDIRPFEVRCSLCGQEHMDGRIVALADKSITNIGHICGRKFGDKYADALRAYNETLDRPRLTQKITEGLSMIESQQLQLHTLRTRSVELKKRSSSFQSIFPETFNTLRRRAYNNQFEIYESVMRGEEEIEDLLAANPHQSREFLRTKEVHRGSITGHKFPITDWSTDQGVFRVFAEADKFSELKAHNLPMVALTKWANWLDDFDENLRLAKVAIEEGDNFFTAANLKMCALLPSTPAAQAKFQTFKVSDFDKYQHTEASPQNNVRPTSGIVRAKKAAPTLTPRQLHALTGNKKMRL